MTDHRVLRGYLRACAVVFGLVAALFMLVALVVPPLVVGAVVAGVGAYLVMRLSRGVLGRRSLLVAVAVHVVAAVAAAVYAFTALGAGGEPDRYEPVVVQVLFLGLAVGLAVAGAFIARAALRTPRAG